MRKLVLVALFGVLGFAVWPEASSACWWHRRARSCPLPCYAPCPATLTAHFPPKAVLSTEELRSPSGRVHRLHTIDDIGWQEPTPRPGAVQPESLAGTPSSPAETFAGHDREAAKTAVAHANITFFAALSSLIATLPSDHFMRNQHQPPISTAQDSGRVAEEQRNITVTAYLVATKKESDNDYHLLLATTPNGAGPYLTAEVSGLPRMGSAQDKATLTNTRAQYRTLLQSHMPGSRYMIVDPPLPVRLTGSLFFDMDHVAGVVGTGNFVPNTSWEVHPVTSIVHAP